MTTDLPTWVLDLVAAVQRYEDTHPETTSNLCLAAPYDNVPEDVRLGVRIGVQLVQAHEAVWQEQWQARFDAAAAEVEERLRAAREAAYDKGWGDRSAAALLGRDDPAYLIANRNPHRVSSSASGYTEFDPTAYEADPS